MNEGNLIFSRANRRSFISQLMVALGAGKVSKASRAEAATGRARQFDPPVDSSQSSTSQVAACPHQGGYIRPGTIEVVHQKFDLVVVGGGIAGTCAAISAARNGTRVGLVHERAMLGGNSSSEVCLYPEDTVAYNPWIKETGIIEEIMNEERARNWVLLHEGMINTQWDLVLYEWAIREKNLTLFLNTSLREVEMANPQEIRAIRAVQLGSERGFILQAPLFVDATGDRVLAYHAGAEFRWGQEAREEYHELLAPVRATDAVMGNTLYFRAHDVGRPIKFKKPEWAVAFDTEADLTGRHHGFFEAGYS